MKTKTRAVALCVTAIMIGSISLMGCGKKDGAAQAGADGGAGGAAQQMPPTTVDVQVVELGLIPMSNTLSGRIAAAEVSEVRPQVSGIIDEILFQEGSVVQAGQPLYRINTDNYASSVSASEASLNQAQANVGVAKAGVITQQANLEQAQSDLNRLKGLLEAEAISKQAHEQAVTRVKTAKAALEQARANLASAEASVHSAEAGLSARRLDLNRTIVRAPISGKTSISAVTKGALVAAGQATPLVTISRTNPVFVDISQSSSDILRLRQALASGSASEGSPEIELVLEDGTPYPIKGQLMLSNAHVNEATGAVIIRAILPNPQGLLIPGMYVNARLNQSMANNAVLIPQSAIMRTAKGETQVYIVNKDKKIELRNIKTTNSQDGKWLVTEGLKTGDQVVVQGANKVQPDQVVEVRTLPAAQQTPATQNGFAAPQDAQDTQDAQGQNSVLASPAAPPAQDSPAKENAPASAASNTPEQGTEPSTQESNTDEQAMLDAADNN